MDRLDALKELLVKVESGDGEATFEEYYHCFHRHTFNALNAFNGSLDAAKALHEAVLPDRTWDVSIFHEQDAMASVYLNSHKPWFRAFNPEPARAWLISIIKALIAQEE